MSRTRKAKVVSHGKKPPQDGVTRPKKPKETTFQKELKKWPPKKK